MENNNYGKSWLNFLIIDSNDSTTKSELIDKLQFYNKYLSIDINELVSNELKVNTINSDIIKQKKEANEDISTDIIINLLLKYLNKLDYNNKKIIITNFPILLNDLLLFENKISKNFKIVTYYNNNYLEGNEGLNNCINFYGTLNMLLNIHSDSDIDSDILYNKVLDYLRINVILFNNFKSQLITNNIIKFSNKIGYQFIDFKQLCVSNNLTKCEDKVAYLYSYLDSSYDNNFVIYGLPENIKQINILKQYNINILKIYQKEENKEDIIQNNKLNTTDLDEQLKKYYYNKDQMFNLLKINDIYTVYNSDCLDINDFFKAFNIKIFGTSIDSNNNFVTEFSKLYNFKVIDINKILEFEQMRNPNFSIDNVAKVLPKLLFSNLKSYNQFIITSVPIDIEYHQKMSENYFRFEYFVTFVNKSDEKTHIEFEFDESHSQVISYYIQSDSIIKIHNEDINLISNYIKKKYNYGLVIGPKHCGKTTICNSLKALGFEVLQFEQFNEESCKKLGTEDEPLEKLTEDQIYSELISKFKQNPNKIIFLDSFPFETVFDYKQLFETVGNPVLILKLMVNNDNIRKRYIEKNELGEEISEKEEEEINNIIITYNSISKYASELLEKDYYLNIYDINGNLTIDQTIGLLSKINNYKIIYVRNKGGDNNIMMKKMFMSLLAFRFNYKYIDLDNENIFENGKDKFDKLKEYLSQIDYNIRNILLFETQDNDDVKLFLNIYYKLSKITALYDIDTIKVNPYIEEEIEEKEVKEQPESTSKTKNEDNSNNEEEEPNKEEEEEENKNKFDPSLYDWTKVSNSKKTTENLYVKMSPNTKVLDIVMKEAKEQLYNATKELIITEERGESISIYAQIYK